MWRGMYIEDIVKRFLPSTAKIVILDNPSKAPAIKLIDLDGDGILELLLAYYWQGEIYIRLLKYNKDEWYVAATVKGKGYDITFFKSGPITDKKERNLIVGWKVASIWSDLSVYQWKDAELKELIEGNKYYSLIDVKDIESTKGKDGIDEIALWKHDTGEAYKVEIYRWVKDQFVLATDLYPSYFKKVENYYKKLLKKKDSTTYWYYLADAQLKIGNTQEALKSIDKALSFEYPYPSKEELLVLKKSTCEYEPFSDEHGIDFSSIRYICSETESDKNLEKAIKKEFDLSLNEENIRYYYNKVDLNEDGIPEVFVFIVGPFVCGTGGCSATIFKEENGEYKTLSRLSLVRNPVIISNSKTNGYKDLIMYVAGGGIESFFAELKYDGSTYPSNPSIQPKVESGTKVEGIAIVSDDISKSSGIDL